MKENKILQIIGDSFVYASCQGEDMTKDKTLLNLALKINEIGKENNS